MINKYCSNEAAKLTRTIMHFHPCMIITTLSSSIPPCKSLTYQHYTELFVLLKPCRQVALVSVGKYLLCCTPTVMRTCYFQTGKPSTAPSRIGCMFKPLPYHWSIPHLR